MINWFPGHMAKATKQLQKSLKYIDLVVEILDARIPRTSSNPFLIELLNGKPVLKVLNKFDLANPSNLNKWEKYFKDNNINYLKLNSKNSSVKNQLMNKINEVLANKIAKDLKRNIKNPQFYICVIGIPNVGKSTFINNIVNKKSTKTGNKPGLTKGEQWIKITNSFHLLDTPGILFPKISDDQEVVKLIICNNIKSEIIPKPEYLYKIITWLYETNIDHIVNEYNVNYETIEKIKNNSESLELFYILLTSFIISNYYGKFDENLAYDKMIFDLQGSVKKNLKFEFPVDIKIKEKNLIF